MAESLSNERTQTEQCFCNRVIIGSMENHRRIFHDPKTHCYRCVMCGNDSLTASSLKMHMSHIHSRNLHDAEICRIRVDPPFSHLVTCNYCTYTTADSPDRLNNHVRRAHPHMADRLEDEIGQLLEQNPHSSTLDFALGEIVSIVSSEDPPQHDISPVRPLRSNSTTSEAVNPSEDDSHASTSLLSTQTSSQSAVSSNDNLSSNLYNYGTDYSTVYIAGQAVDSLPEHQYEPVNEEIPESDSEDPPVNELFAFDDELFIPNPQTPRLTSFIGGYLIETNNSTAQINNTVKFSFVPPDGLYTVLTLHGDVYRGQAHIHSGFEPSNPTTSARVEVFDYHLGKQYICDVEFTRILAPGEYTMCLAGFHGLDIPFIVESGWRQRQLSQQINLN